MPKPKIIKATRVAFTQEGEHLIFTTAEGEGWGFADQEFNGCCDFEATGNTVIVKTQSLQEMGYTLPM